MVPSNSLVLKATVFMMVATAPVACPHVLLDKPVQLVQANVRTRHAPTDGKYLFPMTTKNVNVVHPVVFLAKLAPRLRVLVNIYLALMRQNLSLVSKTAAEIQLALTVNVVRTFVLKEMLQFAPRRPTFARTLVQGTMTRPMGIYRQVLTREVAH